MKFVYLFVALNFLTVSVHAVIPNLSGNYRLNVAKENCPSNIKISQAAGDLIIYTGKCEGCERYYGSINKGIESHNDDFGVSTQTKSVFKDNTLQDLSRPCEGLLFKKCGDWTLNSTLTILNKESIEISTPDNANKYDLAGFPVGESCYYSK